MSDEVKDRIEKEAEEYCKEKYTPKIAEFAKSIYVYAATEANAHLIAAAPDLLKENQSLKSELQKLQNDLDDALDVKNGKGPTALSRLSNELQKQKELNAELVKRAIDEFIKLDYRSYTLAEIKLVLYSLIKKSSEI